MLSMLFLILQSTLNLTKDVPAKKEFTEVIESCSDSSWFDNLCLLPFTPVHKKKKIEFKFVCFRLYKGGFSHAGRTSGYTVTAIMNCVCGHQDGHASFCMRSYTGVIN